MWLSWSCTRASESLAVLRVAAHTRQGAARDFDMFSLKETREPARK
jgi:hypothetical protein